MFIILFLLIPKKQFYRLVLNKGCFLLLLKLNRKLLEKQTWFQKRKIKQNNQYLNLNFSRQYKRSFLILKTTGLKLISRQEKRIFTSCCFKDTFLVLKINYVPIGSAKKTIWLISVTMPLQSNMFNI